MNLENIHIGSLIQYKVEELNISIERITVFLDCDEKWVGEIYLQKEIDTDVLLMWCKLLRFDFFRIFTGHLILYSPPSKVGKMLKKKESTLIFRKNIYTEEVKKFIIEKVRTEQMTLNDVVSRYKIPKTTLSKWLKKV